MNARSVCGPKSPTHSLPPIGVEWSMELSATAGLEVVINSEVWDLRTLSLLRSCPALDGAAVTFAGADVLFAIQRPISDDLREALA